MHILIVDDDQSFRRALGRAIELAGYDTEHGHRVSTARDGDECRRVVADGAVDVILMDGDLDDPRENGPQVVATLRQAGYTEKIIMTSSKPALAEEGLRAGADASCDKVDLGVDPRTVLSSLGVSLP